MSICAHTLQNICPNRCMGSRFILPCFIGIFDIYILDAVSTYVYANELYACQIGSKHRNANIYVEISIYVSKFQYTVMTKCQYVSALYKIYVQIDVWDLVLYCLVLM